MREILFRGKALCGKWVEGLPYEVDGVIDCIRVKERIQDIISYTTYKVIPKSISEFTGLTDKNGKKIFDGDIVAYGTNTARAENKEKHEVVFETRGGSAYFGIKISDIETWNFCLEVPAKLMEVIGNIHDNPELLKGGVE